MLYCNRVIRDPSGKPSYGLPPVKKMNFTGVYGIYFHIVRVKRQTK